MSPDPVSAFEDLAAVEAYHAALRRDPRPALARARQVREAYEARGVELMPWRGWPLRPLLVDRRRLDFLAWAYHRRMDQLRRAILKLADDPQRLGEALGLSPRVVALLTSRAALRSPGLLGMMRPDGYLYRDRFVLGELNFGNGALVSNAYTEVLYDLHAGDPILAGLGLEPASLPRPLQAWIGHVRGHLRRPTRRKRIALLAHSVEWACIQGWEKRVHDQFDAAIAHLAAAGLDAEVVHEDDLEVGPDGWPRRRGGRGRYHGVVMITIGTSFMEAPDRLEGDMAPFTGARLGRAPFVKPLVSLLFDKGAMPWMGELADGPLVAPDGFRFEIAETEFPAAERFAGYRLRKDEWVMKRSYDGKDTWIGVAEHGRVWNRALERAMGNKDYVMQRYHALPETLVPVSPDGEAIEWVKVRVELSPFVLEGRYEGACARWAPTREGLILSPPPDDMGFGTVLPT